ncbi:MAG: 3-deoxy-8-phosphooctulonate synthase, partial [Zetaproteobacteria bacterium]
MSETRIQLGGMTIANDRPLVLLAGPCVIEGEDFTLRVAEQLGRICADADVPLVFKSSFDKANRTSR